MPPHSNVRGNGRYASYRFRQRFQSGPAAYQSGRGGRSVYRSTGSALRSEQYASHAVSTESNRILGDSLLGRSIPRLGPDRRANAFAANVSAARRFVW